MFESLASCFVAYKPSFGWRKLCRLRDFAFLCSASLNVTALVKIAVLHRRKGRAGSPLQALLQFRMAARTEWRALPEIHLRIFSCSFGETYTDADKANRFAGPGECFSERLGLVAGYPHPVH
jgi:hypothetical protein